MKINEIKKQLKIIGLSEKEIEIYIATVKIGPAFASVIAKIANLPRQTTYSILEALLRIGIVRASDQSSVKKFSADPQELLIFLEQKREMLKRAKDELEKSIPDFIQLRQGKINTPKIVYYEGEDGLKLLLKNILSYYKNGGEKMFRAYGVNKFHGILGDYLYEFAEERADYDVETHLCISDAPNDFGIIDEKSALKRRIKRLRIAEQDAGMYLVGNKIFFFSYKEQVGIMIEDEAIVRLLKAVFDDHWERVPKEKLGEKE